MDAMKSVNKLMPKVVVVSLENRQHVAPKYLFAQIPRIHYEAIETGRKSKDVRPILQAKMVKIWTQVALHSAHLSLACGQSSSGVVAQQRSFSFLCAHHPRDNTEEIVHLDWRRADV